MSKAPRPIGKMKMKMIGKMNTARGEADIVCRGANFVKGKVYNTMRCSVRMLVVCGEKKCKGLICCGSSGTECAWEARSEGEEPCGHKQDRARGSRERWRGKRGEP